MAQYIDKAEVMAEIESYKDSFCDRNGYLEDSETNGLAYDTLCELGDSINTLEVKEVDLLTDRKTNWRPSKKQMKSLHDMLKYNIGVFDYQKFMEVNSLYDDLTKICDYETDRKK